MAKGKLINGFTMAAPGTPTQGDSLAEYVAKHRRRFAENLRLAIDSGDVESIHDLRVASRRLTEPLKLLGKWTCRRQTQHVLKSLKKTRNAFRRVRDFDVVLAGIRSRESTSILGADDHAQLEGLLTRARDRAFARAQRECRRSNSEEAATRIESILSQFTESLCDEIHAGIETRVSALVASWTLRLIEKDPRDPLTTDLHDTRLCAKRLRYAVELFRDICHRPDDPRTTALAAMQEVLGHWNDQLMIASRILAVARRPDVLATHAGWATKLLELASACIRSAEADRPRIIAVWDECHALLQSTDLSQPEADGERAVLARNEHP
ncbi:MAG: CHAD domain-containing protein [Planctomycetes bacterium]|nr:CHAD domain-containing protein [Planctomycetota bacterium]